MGPLLGQPCLLPRKPGERLDDFKQGCDGIPAAFQGAAAQAIEGLLQQPR